MTRQEIYDKVCSWIQSGKLVQKSSVSKGDYWYSVWRRVSNGELFFTSIDRIVATDKDVRDEFDKFIRDGRVMTSTGITIQHPECTSVYSVCKFVEQNKLLRIGEFSSITLYVE